MSTISGDAEDGNGDSKLGGSALGGGEEGDTEDAEQQFQQTQEPDSHPWVGPRWRTKAFALECVIRLVQLCDSDRTHFNMTLVSGCFRYIIKKYVLLIFFISQIQNQVIMTNPSTLYVFFLLHFFFFCIFPPSGSPGASSFTVLRRSKAVLPHSARSRTHPHGVHGLHLGRGTADGIRFKTTANGD